MWRVLVHRWSLCKIKLKKACVFEELYINSLTVPAGQTVAVLCCASCGPLGRRTPALFEPTPDETWPDDLEVSEQLLTLPRGIPNRVNIAVLRTPQVKLGDLTESQPKMAMKMMTEQAESFAQNDDDDVECIEGLQLNLELSDTSPVQTTYTPIPRPMYAEVKALH